jgi:hypothetical protein
MLLPGTAISIRNRSGKANRVMFCDKTQFEDKREARAALNRLRKGRIYYDGKRRKIKKLPVRIYFCEECNKWHMTSQRYEQ